MRVCVLVVSTLMLCGSRAAPPASAILELEDTVSEILSELENIPLEERLDDSVAPELMELYHDVATLFEVQKSNITDSREGRGFLSKLSFLTGLKLGSFLTSSGTLAASQSINFLGKVLNAALSISYGNIGGYPSYGGGITGGGIDPIGEVGALDGPLALPKLPVIQEDVPNEDKKREKPDDTPLATTSSVPVANQTARVAAVDKVRKEFLKNHNQRVESFNNNFEKKIRSRTGRTEESKSYEVS